jgi:copper transport protein
MPQQLYGLKQTGPGIYSRQAPALVMVGKWGLTFQVAPPGGASFTAEIVDHAEG